MGKDAAGTEYWKHEHWERLLQSIPSSYTVWNDGGTYRAECNIKGGTDYSSAIGSTVIQNGINALTSGGHIHIRNGTYTIGTMLSILAPNIIITGDGPSTILSLNNNVDTETIRIGDLTHSGTGTILENFAIDGNKANQAGGHGIRIYSDTWLTENVHINHLLVENAYASGISVDSGVNCSVENSILKSNGSSGLYFENTGKCHVSNVMSQSNVNGFSTNSVDTVTFIGCIARSNSEYGFGFSSDTGNILEGCIARDNLLDGLRIDTAEGDVISGGWYYANGLDGIKLNGCNGTILDGLTVFDNTENGVNIGGANIHGEVLTGLSIFTNSHNGLVIDGQTGLSVTGGCIRENGREGIDLIGGSTKCSFTGITLYDNSSANHNGWSNIHIRGTSLRNTFTGINSGIKTTSDNQYGLLEDDNSDYTVIVGGYYYGHDGGISTSGANTKKNLCYNNDVWIA